VRPASTSPVVGVQVTDHLLVRFPGRRPEWLVAPPGNARKGVLVFCHDVIAANTRVGRRCHARRRPLCETASVINETDARVEQSFRPVAVYGNPITRYQTWRESTFQHIFLSKPAISRTACYWLISAFSESFWRSLILLQRKCQAEGSESALTVVYSRKGRLWIT